MTARQSFLPVSEGSRHLQARASPLPSPAPVPPHATCAGLDTGAVCVTSLPGGLLSVARPPLRPLRWLRSPVGIHPTSDARRLSRGQWAVTSLTHNIHSPWPELISFFDQAGHTSALLCGVLSVLQTRPEIVSIQSFCPRRFYTVGQAPGSNKAPKAVWALSSAGSDRFQVLPYLLVHTSGVPSWSACPLSHLKPTHPPTSFHISSSSAEQNSVLTRNPGFIKTRSGFHSIPGQRLN
jgi:hypothetical protein